jgi:hypothetical protein
MPMQRALARLLVLLACVAGPGSGRAVADMCAANHREHPQSYIGAARPDASNPDEIDPDWLSRIPIGEANIAKYPGGPIWDGDSTANDDANYLTQTLPGTSKTEYASLGWGHPVNLAVSGEYVPNVLYRLYAMEQRFTFSIKSAPFTLTRASQNFLAFVRAPFLVLHVGTNELYKSESAPDIVADIEALTCELHQDLPLVGKIVVVSIYPRGAFFNLDVAKREQINQGLSTAAATGAYPFIFVDATSYLEKLCQGNFDSKGQCSYFKDLTHPKAQAAYAIDQLIARAVK